MALRTQLLDWPPRRPGGIRLGVSESEAVQRHRLVEFEELGQVVAELVNLEYLAHRVGREALARRPQRDALGDATRLQQGLDVLRPRREDPDDG